MRCVGAESRCGKTVAKEILSKINNAGYGKYYNDLYGNHPRGLLRNRMNCSDTAPHQKEIEELTRAGFSPDAINAILALHYAHELDVEKVADNVKVRLKKGDNNDRRHL